jgi:parallel beta-helix repeat protein
MSLLVGRKSWSIALLLGLVVCGATVSRSRINRTTASAPFPAPIPGQKPTIPNIAETGSASYFVSPDGDDSNDGSEQHPWRTIQHAASVGRAGAAVHVASGNYAGPITSSNSGTATARIRFVSDVQWGAVIRATRANIVWTNLGDYVDIQGFDIAGNDPATCNGIITYASYVRIIGNHVHDLGRDTAACRFGSGIVDHNNRAAHDDEVIGNVIHDIGDLRHPRQWHHGIYHANLRGRIVNNIVYRCEGWGIHLWHAATQVTITNNTIFNNAYGGILIGDGDDPGGFPPGVVNDYTVVANNIVYSNGLGRDASGYGIEEYGATGAHNQYLNNLVYLNGPANWNLKNGNRAEETISADPRFVNYQPDGTGDYRLAPNSPALKAGTPAHASPSGGELDLGAQIATSQPPASTLR